MLRTPSRRLLGDPFPPGQLKFLFCVANWSAKAAFSSGNISKVCKYRTQFLISILRGMPAASHCQKIRPRFASPGLVSVGRIGSRPQRVPGQCDRFVKLETCPNSFRFHVAKNTLGARLLSIPLGLLERCQKLLPFPDSTSSEALPGRALKTFGWKAVLMFQSRPSRPLGRTKRYHTAAVVLCFNPVQVAPLDGLPVRDAHRGRGKVSIPSKSPPWTDSNHWVHVVHFGGFQSRPSRPLGRTFQIFEHGYRDIVSIPSKSPPWTDSGAIWPNH